MLNWLIRTEGNDGPDYAGVVLLFLGGKLRVPLILYGCPFNAAAKAHDEAYNEIDWGAGETSDEVDLEFYQDCVRAAHRMAKDNPTFLAHLLWLAEALYKVAANWGCMRARLAKWHLNWS